MPRSWMTTRPRSEPGERAEHEHRRNAETEFEQRGPTVRDRRRIDPETYEVREPQRLRLLPPAPKRPANPVSDAEAEVIELKAAWRNGPLIYSGSKPST